MSSLQRTVGAILVTRGDSPLIQSVLRAIDEQTVAPHSVTVVDVAGRHVTPFPAERLPEGADIVRVGRARNLGDAIRRAQSQGGAFASHQWWWILHDDCAPEPECLGELTRAASVGKTVAAVGVKQLSWDGRRLLELGIFATASARRLERVGEGDIDQGQHDGTCDVLGVGTAGLLLRADAYEAVGGFDPALGPFGDGLDMGRRLHLAGYRVIVAPRARVRHARASLHAAADPAGASALTASGSPEGSRESSGDACDEDASFRRRRYAQLYNWCKAVPLLALPFLALWLLVWTPARAIGRITTGRAALALPELGALASLIGATPRLLLGRARAAKSRVVPRSSLRALEEAPSALRTEPARAEEDDSGERIDPLVLASMWRYRIRSASTLAAVLIGTSLVAILQWWGAHAGLVGGAWVSLPTSWTQLWSAAWSGWIPGGDGHAGGADPMTILLAILSAPLAPLGVTPGATATFLLVASSPIAALAAWVPTRSLTASLRMRALLTLAWSFAPPLMLSGTHGVLAGGLAHAAMPIAAAYCLRAPAPLLVDGAAGVVAAPTRPRGISAGCASLAVLVLACCAPWTLALAATVLALRSWRRLLVALPAAVVLAPTLVSILAHPISWPALTSTAGGVHAYTRAPSWLALLALPAAPASALEGIALALIGGAVLVAAIASLAITRSRPALTASCGAALAAAIGWCFSHVGVGLHGSLVASAWTSPFFSLSFLALLGVAARLAIPSGTRVRGGGMERAWDASRPLILRASAAVALLALLGSGGVAAASALGMRVDASSLPTYALSQRETVSVMSSPIVSAVASQAQRHQRAGRILVLDGDPNSGTVNAMLWRGAGVSLTDSSPASRARSLGQARAGATSGVLSDPATASLAQAAYTLVVYPDDATVEQLAAHDVDTILVPLGASGATALADGLDRASGLEKVGQTTSGTVWRVRPDGIPPSRVRIDSAGGGHTVVGSSQLAVDGEVNAAGTLILAERADLGWHASVDGVELAPTEAPGGWAQAFDMPAAGSLSVAYRAWWILPWRIGVGICLIVAAASALSVRRSQ